MSDTREQDDLTRRAAAIAPWDLSSRTRWMVVIATVVLIAVFWAVYWMAADLGSQRRDGPASTSDRGCEVAADGGRRVDCGR